MWPDAHILVDPPLGRLPQRYTSIVRTRFPLMPAEPATELLHRALIRGIRALSSCWKTWIAARMGTKESSSPRLGTY
jgi:hypothetical protein